MLFSPWCRRKAVPSTPIIWGLLLLLQLLGRSHGAIDEFLGSINPIKPIPFEAIHLDACDETRAAMIAKDPPKFLSFARTLESKLKVGWNAAVVIWGLERTRLTGFVPPLFDPEDGEGQAVAFYVQAIAELALNNAYPTDILSMIRDLYKFVCEGGQSTVVSNGAADLAVTTDGFTIVQCCFKISLGYTPQNCEPYIAACSSTSVQVDPRFKNYMFFFKAVGDLLSAKGPRQTGVRFTDSGKAGKFYRRTNNGGFPILVFKNVLRFFESSLNPLWLLRNIPFRPLQRMINTVRATMKTPEEAVEKLRSALEVQCAEDSGDRLNPQVNPRLLQIAKVESVFRYLKMLRYLLVIVAQGHRFDLEDHVEEIEEIKEYLLQGIEPKCESTITVSDTPGNEGAVERYLEQLQMARRWQEEANEYIAQQKSGGGARRLGSADRLLVVDDPDTRAAFEADIAELERIPDFLMEWSNALDALEDALKDALQSLQIDGIGGWEDIFRALLITYPNRLQDTVEGLASMLNALAPLISVLNAVESLNIKIPSSPLTLLSDAVEQLICVAVDAVGKATLGEDNLCGKLESFIVSWLNRLLEPLGIFDLPSPEELFGRFNSILDTFLNLWSDILDNFSFASFLPEPFYSFPVPPGMPSFPDLFGPDFLAKFENIFVDLIKRPEDVYFAYEGTLTTTFEEGLSVDRSFTSAVDSTTISFSCPDGLLPIVNKAKFVGSFCQEELTGVLRFPCGKGLSSCVLDYEPFLFDCSFPEPDPLINDLMGMTRATLYSSYYCFEEEQTWKLVPDILTGDTRVHMTKVVEKRWTTDEIRSFGVDSGDEAMNFNLDLFPRPAFRIDRVDARNMDCSGNGRVISIAAMKEYIDPCVNKDPVTGKYHNDFRYGLEPRRFTSLCGYKILFDEDRLSCSSFSTGTSFVEQNRLGPLSRVVVGGNEGYTEELCWRNVSELDWEFLATKIERCELRTMSYRGGTYYCPFGQDFQGVVNSVNKVCDYRDKPRAGYCKFDPKNPPKWPPGHRLAGQPMYDEDLCFIDSVYDAGTLQISVYNYNSQYNWAASDDPSDTSPPFASYGAYSYTPGRASLPGGSIVDCAIRDSITHTPNRGYFAFTNMGGSYKDFPGTNPRTRNDPYDSWRTVFDDFQSRCLGPTGAIANCVNNPNGKCNLQEINCVPPEWLYLCVFPSRDQAIFRTHVAHSPLLPPADKQISCPVVATTIQGVSVTKVLSIVSVLEAETGDGISFTWLDITQQVRDFCSLGPNVNACTLSPANYSYYPALDHVWEIDYFCLCPENYVRESLDDGSCEPCQAGSDRSFGEIACSECAPGTFSPTSGSPCQECEAGSYWPGVGATQCLPCPSGSFMNSTGAFECLACPVGTYANSSGQSECTPADPGYFVPEVGASSQIPCDPGSFTEGGADSCSLCPAGTFSLGAGYLCEPCEPGTYAVQLGTPQCRLCPQDFYASSTGATTCCQCPAGTTTTVPGARNLSDCVGTLTPDTERAILLDGASAEFNGGPLEQLPDNGFSGRVITSVQSGCLDLLRKYLGQDVDVSLALQEIGNGFCNHGPWNTQSCSWDGGDCCQTCEPLLSDVFDPELDEIDAETGRLSGQCDWQNFDCRAGGGASSQCPSSGRRELLEKDPSFPISRDQFVRAWVARAEKQGQHSRQERHLQEEVGSDCAPPSRVGNGVCDPDLNNDEDGNNWDGGDCCPETCMVNAAYQESCSAGSFASPEGSSNCTDGYGCCDPLVVGQEFATTDMTPPLVNTASEFTVECGSPEMNALLDRSIESPLSPTVTDNNPCFIPEEAVVTVEYEPVTQQASSCGGLYSLLKYKYTAFDLSGNMGSALLQVAVADTTPPTMECPLSLSYHTENIVSLPPIAASDECNSLVVTGYAFSGDSLTINNELLEATLGNPALEEDYELTAYAQDSCGNLVECTVLLEFIPEPSSQPSELPSTSPSSSPSETEVPSSVPSPSPSDSPSDEPSLTPSISLAPTFCPRTLELPPSIQIDSYQERIVDGNVQEGQWDTEKGFLEVAMTEDGTVDRPALAFARLGYDCSRQVLYVRVLTTGQAALQDISLKHQDSWVDIGDTQTKHDASAKDSALGSFRYLHVDGIMRGFESKLDLPLGSETYIEAHVIVSSSIEGSGPKWLHASTGSGENQACLSLEKACPPPSRPTMSPAPTLPAEFDLCVEEGKPVRLTFLYHPGTSDNVRQDPNQAYSSGDAVAGTSAFVQCAQFGHRSTSQSDIFVVDDSKKSVIYFMGTVNVGSSFTVSSGDSDNLSGSKLRCSIWADEESFLSQSDPVQAILYQMSCSEPIYMGDTIGSIQLVGYSGTGGS